jgi:hypothetical protein
MEQISNPYPRNIILLSSFHNVGSYHLSLGWQSRIQDTNHDSIDSQGHFSSISWGQKDSKIQKNHEVEIDERVLPTQVVLSTNILWCIQTSIACGSSKRGKS